jgi:hypothetical protein
MKKSIKIILILVVVILVAILIWGLIGSSEAAKVGTTCKLGVGEDGSVFCWTWYRNTVGQIGDTLEGLF